MYQNVDNLAIIAVGADSVENPFDPVSDENIYPNKLYIRK